MTGSWSGTDTSPALSSLINLIFCKNIVNDPVIEWIHVGEASIKALIHRSEVVEDVDEELGGKRVDGGPGARLS